MIRRARLGATIANVVGAKRRFAVLLATDALWWSFAVVAAAALRFDLVVDHVPWRATFAGALLAAELHVALMMWLTVRRGRARYGSFADVLATGVAAALTTGALFVINLVVLERMLPISVTAVAGPLALGGMVVTRTLWRLELAAARRPGGDAERVAVFGAGEGATQIITAMLNDRHSPFLPVALFDDNPLKRDLRILGVPVRGGRGRLQEVAATLQLRTVVIAIPSAPAELVRELTHVAAEAGLRVLVVPPVGELIGGPRVTDIRPVTAADLLGRHEIETDVRSIAGYVTGKRVLVTGAGGSIGSELCRQIHGFEPSALVMLDRDESALHSLQLQLTGRALLGDPHLVVANICDAERVMEVFKTFRPDVVFHAAALKHLPLLELHPEEAVKNNILGTRNVLRAARGLGVQRFVNISTDKAAQPASVLGRSKRIAERLTASAGSCSEGVYLSVRFGNVLGSRGSVLSTFRAQIDSGGPITVTDPEVTRYFMTVHEAVQLVIQAGAIGSSGEVLVLDMGEPVRILEVAERLAEASGKPIDIVFTGLRPGEKLHEDRLASEEMDRRPVHPLISHVAVPPLRDDDLLFGPEVPARELVTQLDYLASCADVAVTEPSRIAQ